MILNNNSWMTKPIINEKMQVSELNEARGKKIADPLRAKLMGMEDIRALKGTMTPRYFATKVIRYLQKNYPELDVSDLSDDDIQQAINVVSQVSKPLAQKPEVKITTRERGAAEGGLKKGDSGFETLQLNLGGDTVLKSEGEVGENDLYTAIKDGLKYRVTLNKFKGTKINLDDITKDDIVSVVVVKPSEMETVDKFAGEVELGQREKLVADYPEGEEETMDMDDVIDAVRQGPREEDNELDLAKGLGFKNREAFRAEYRKAGGINQYFQKNPDKAKRLNWDIDDSVENNLLFAYNPENYEKEERKWRDDPGKEGDLEDYELEDRRMRMDFPIDPDSEIGPEDGESSVSKYYKQAYDYAKENPDVSSFQVNPYEEFSDEYLEFEDGFEDGLATHREEDAESCPYSDEEIDTEKADLDDDGEVSEYERKRGEAIAKAMQRPGEKKEEEDEEVAMSPQAIQQHLINQYRQQMQNQYSHERRNRYGY